MSFNDFTFTTSFEPVVKPAVKPATPSFEASTHAAAKTDTFKFEVPAVNLNLSTISGHVDKLKVLDGVSEDNLKIIAKALMETLSVESPEAAAYVELNKGLLIQLVGSFSPFFSGPEEQAALNTAIRILKII